MYNKIDEINPNKAKNSRQILSSNKIQIKKWFC